MCTPLVYAVLHTLLVDSASLTKPVFSNPCCPSRLGPLFCPSPSFLAPVVFHLHRHAYTYTRLQSAVYVGGKSRDAAR